MCGLIALLGPVPVELAQQAVRYAGDRGPHTWGWAELQGDRWTREAGPGRLQHHPALLEGGCLIGHSRLATCGGHPGDAPPISEAQPYAEGEAVIAHNGTIPQERVAHLVEPAPAVDSMVLLLALTRRGLNPAQVLEGSAAPQAVLWALGGRVWALRVPGGRQPAHPLYVAHGDGWAAVSSGPIWGGTLLPEHRPQEVTP